MEDLTNRVAESEIQVFNLEHLLDGWKYVELDLEPFLVEGLMLREKDFREDVKAHDWDRYQDAHVAVFCSTDAIIPTWAYMLIASKLDGIAASVTSGRKEDALREYFVRVLEDVDWSKYNDGIVVVKGCGTEDVPVSAYMQALQRLQQVARKLMFGEPCSSVPLWRKPQSTQKKPPAKATAISANLPTGK